METKLTIPDEFLQELQDIADAYHVQPIDVVRRFLLLGVFVVSVEGNDGIFIRENGVERKVLLF